jgi:hypothetical protein
MPDLDRALRELLTDEHLDLRARPDATRIVHDGVRRRRRRRTIATGAAAAAAVGATIAAATALPAAFDAGSTSPTPMGPSGQYDVAWVDQPAPKMWSPTPVQPPPPSMDAPRCLADQLKVARIEGNGAGGLTFHIIVLRNISEAPCLLVGPPAAVTARSPGKPDVVATQGLHLDSSGVGGDLPPGELGYLTIETDRDCPARYATANSFPTDNYSSLSVRLPSGTTLDTPLALDVECGLKAGGLGVDQPPATEPVDPRTDLRPTIASPDSVRAGQTLTYVVTLTNPTGSTISLSHCPGYVEWMGTDAAGVAKESLGLNCSTIEEIAAGASVRYEMRIAVPADAHPGPLTLRWMLQAAAAPQATSTVTVEQP